MSKTVNVPIHAHPKALKDRVIRCIISVMSRFGCEAPDKYIPGKVLEERVLSESGSAVFHAFGDAMMYDLIVGAESTRPDRPGPPNYRLTPKGCALAQVIRDEGGWEIGTKKATPITGDERISEEFGKLKPAQQEVLKRLVDGIRDEDIAEDMKTSVSTVRKHITAACKVLDLENRNKLIAWGARQGL